MFISLKTSIMYSANANSSHNNTRVMQIIEGASLCSQSCSVYQSTMYLSHSSSELIILFLHVRFYGSTGSIIAEHLRIASRLMSLCMYVCVTLRNAISTQWVGHMAYAGLALSIYHPWLVRTNSLSPSYLLPSILPMLLRPLPYNTMSL